MFLVNSRIPRVIETCPIAGQAPLIPKLRGYFAEFPKRSYLATPEAFHLGAPVSDLGTNTSGPKNSLFMDSWGRRNHPKAAIHDLDSFSPLRYSTVLFRLGTATAALQLPGSVRNSPSVATCTDMAPEY